MLAHRLRRWTNITPAVAQRLELSGRHIRKQAHAYRKQRVTAQLVDNLVE